ADTLCRDGLQTGQGESCALPREPPLDVRIGGERDVGSRREKDKTGHAAGGQICLRNAYFAVF
ncbi:hypothetical protein, partial [Acetobacter indonesiensis]|uniref:hypothetical protein n=1 Tax=Acetobacter indonesiensis TaxID=104101 RepID=UPI000AE60951